MKAKKEVVIQQEQTLKQCSTLPKVKKLPKNCLKVSKKWESKYRIKQKKKQAAILNGIYKLKTSPLRQSRLE